MWSTQPIREMSNRNLLGGKGTAGAQDWQSYRQMWAEYLEKMRELRRLTTLRAFTVCYSENLTFILEQDNRHITVIYMYIVCV
jgi:hypothetical protein